MTEVVSVDDPGRRGRIVGGPRIRTDASVYRIRWNDGSSGWTPEYAFEQLDNADDDVFTDSLSTLSTSGRSGA